ncbi:hypothetical protein Syun_008516 [Stephania yunnanensis]|uniref:Protein yippee-like n=1 Tax=Stephania yunnanensis TaxID=152371 RepID=A0AAP0KD07_9MAGN
MGRVFLVELEGRVYRCKFCRSHLALADDLVSRVTFFLAISLSDTLCLLTVKSRFSGIAPSIMLSVAAEGRRTFSILRDVNITIGTSEERMMLSGMHTVADIFCCCCGQIVGWKYEMAHDKTQKYKEGKIVLERGRIVDGIDSDFYLDTRSGASDAEDA